MDLDPLPGFHVMLDLYDCKLLQLEHHTRHFYTLVTVVPARKKTASSAKKMLQGCIAWTTAVSAATIIPKGVKDFLEYAR